MRKMSFFLRDTVNISLALFLFFVYGYLEVTSRGGVFVVIALGCFFAFLHHNTTINLISLIAMLIHFYDCIFLFANVPATEERDFMVDNKVKGEAKPSYTTIRIPKKSPSNRPSRDVTPLPTIPEQLPEDSMYAGEQASKEEKKTTPSSPVIRLSSAQKKQRHQIIQEAIRLAREEEQHRLDASVRRLHEGKTLQASY